MLKNLKKGHTDVKYTIHVKVHVFVCNYNLRIYRITETTIMKLKKFRKILHKNNHRVFDTIYYMK